MLRSGVKSSDTSTDSTMDKEECLARMISKDKANHVPNSCSSLVVVEFSKKAQPDTIKWIIDKIECPRKLGGGNLCVKRLEEKGTTVLHVGAAIETLVLAAELMEMKKPYKDGLMREIQIDDLDQFKDTEDLEHFLTQAEKQRIVKHELDVIRATEADTSVPGAPKTKLYTGLAIVPECIEDGLITQIYPLHDKQELKKLGSTWYSSFFTIQPIDQIQNYFGETIAMYFAFLGFYTMALIPPAMVGVVSELLRRQFGMASFDLIIFFSIFNLVWATIFLEAWKRNCATLAYKWGTIHTESYEEARPEYYGKLSQNVVTGRQEPKYPKWKRALKFYGVTVPVVGLCLFLAFVVMLWYFMLEDMAIAYHKERDSMFSSMMLFMPTVIYAVIIAIMNALYRYLAKILNDWENHRLQSAYENHLIVKLVLFDFTNCFLSLFYVAFYMQDLKLLRSHLAALLITQQILGQLQESLLPYLMYKWRKAGILKKRKASGTQSEKEPLVGSNGVEEVSSGTCDQAEIEASKDQYLDKQVTSERDLLRHDRGTLDDYLEMFLQFGYVFLFSAVFPTAAFWALINNVTEIRTDAFKLCRIFQRPFSRPTAGIGAWQLAFEVMSAMAVLTNCALLALTPQVSKFVPEYGEVNVLLFFVCAEHLLLFVKLALSYLIPDEPRWVSIALARTAYQSKVAWRKQRVEEAKKHLKDRDSRKVSETILPGNES